MMDQQQQQQQQQQEQDVENPRIDVDNIFDV